MPLKSVQGIKREVLSDVAEVLGELRLWVIERYDDNGDELDMHYKACMRVIDRLEAKLQELSEGY